MTGVRSFDIKAYDNSLADLRRPGMGDDVRLTQLLTPQYMGQTSTVSSLSGGNLVPRTLIITGVRFINNGRYNLLNQTFAHEGRIPPMVTDNRLDASYPNPYYTSPTLYTPQYAGFPNYSSNIGDDNPEVVRLRRVWDSWSTEYTQAPATG